MKLMILVMMLLLTTGCSALQLGQLNSEGVKGSYALCAKGNGPPMTGGGELAVARSGDEFKGSVAVRPGCEIEIKAE